jgi:hypothetical protein
LIARDAYIRRRKSSNILTVHHEELEKQGQIKPKTSWEKRPEQKMVARRRKQKVCLLK